MLDRVLSDRYRLSSLLGEGGMAVVYRAEDLLLGREVAAKVLREQYASDPSFLARFQGEARAAASLSHPNIVAVYDVGSDRGRPYIIMELVAGRNLKELLHHEGPLSAARTIDLGRQVCRALEHAHQHQIVHRDVKPHNILVSSDGRARIADFGIATALGSSSLTQAGHVVGSAHYLSPERARGETATPRSDLYSLGVVLYEMATGRLPFEAETAAAVALKQLQQEPVAPRELNPRMPESLQKVILRAMAKNPGDRFASCEEMAEALNECERAGLDTTRPLATVAAEPPVPQDAATPLPSPGTSDRGRSRRTHDRRWLVTLAALLLTLGSIPLAVVVHSAAGASGQHASQEEVPTLLLPVPTSTGTPTPGPSPTPIRTPSPTPTPAAMKAPILIGMSLPAARQMAQASGLDLVVAGRTYSGNPPDSVLSQKPEPGGPVVRGSRIEVVVSMGMEKVEVPGVLGDAVPVAVARLQAAGFRWRLSYDDGKEEANRGVTTMVVISQNPSPGTAADKGSEIVLVVAKSKRKGSASRSDR